MILDGGEAESLKKLEVLNNTWVCTETSNQKERKYDVKHGELKF